MKYAAAFCALATLIAAPGLVAAQSAVSEPQSAGFYAYLARAATAGPSVPVIGEAVGASTPASAFIGRTAGSLEASAAAGGLSGSSQPPNQTSGALTGQQMARAVLSALSEPGQQQAVR